MNRPGARRIGWRLPLSLLALIVVAVGGYAFGQQRPGDHRQEEQPPPATGAGEMPGMMEGMHGGMMGCPMMMGARVADVSVTPTSDGAVIRMSSRGPEQVDNVQRMALMMGMCMGAEPGAVMPDRGEPR